MNILVNAIRGGLIGLAELVPGVSGGTIALVTGVYERLIHQANRFLDAAKVLPKDRREALRRFRLVDWMLLLPLTFGMLAIVATMAGVMESFVTDHPEASRGFFFGMVLLSISVPLRMIGSAQVKAKLPVVASCFLLAAIATFFLTGLTSAPQSDPNLIWVFLAAAVAVCALVLPGVSGSFFLLAVGLYSATLNAVDNRNLLYIGVFALGALTGIVSFVRLLERLLDRHRTMTLAIMSGLMFGSLRALWPWQTAGADLLAPQSNVGVVVALFALGVAIVAVMIAVEGYFARKHATSPSDAEQAAGASGSGAGTPAG